MIWLGQLIKIGITDFSTEICSWGRLRIWIDSLVLVEGIRILFVKWSSLVWQIYRWASWMVVEVVSVYLLFPLWILLTLLIETLLSHKWLESRLLLKSISTTLILNLVGTLRCSTILNRWAWFGDSCIMNIFNNLISEVFGYFLFNIKTWKFHILMTFDKFSLRMSLYLDPVWKNLA